jgi:hypothetical protein
MLILPQAFVVHALHSSIIIYYARLPNKFLAAIAEHGIDYLDRIREPYRVTLRCTKVYHLRKANERAEIFTLLAKLFWYLISGKSHAGYLFNYSDNPIHIAVCSP